MGKIQEPVFCIVNSLLYAANKTKSKQIKMFYVNIELFCAERISLIPPSSFGGTNATEHNKSSKTIYPFPCERSHSNISMTVAMQRTVPL